MREISRAPFGKAVEGCSRNREKEDPVFPQTCQHRKRKEKEKEPGVILETSAEWVRENPDSSVGFIGSYPRPG